MLKRNNVHYSAVSGGQFYFTSVYTASYHANVEKKDTRTGAGGRNPLDGKSTQ